MSAPIPQDSATGFLYIKGRRMGTSRYELVYTPDSEEEDTVSDGFCVTVFDVEDVRRIVGEYVTHYNTVRLHSAIGYLTPKDKIEGRAETIFAERDRKLAEARERRREQRQAQRAAA